MSNSFANQSITPAPMDNGTNSSITFGTTAGSEIGSEGAGATDNDQFQADYEQLKGTLNDVFMIIMGMVVFFLQAGFAFLEGGAIRSKNMTNILFKNIFDVFLAGISFWLIGYGLAYGQGNWFAGSTYFGSYGLPEEKFAHWFFNYVFTATAATIISGAVAERCQLMAYFGYTILISAIIYPIIVHWAWTSEGWLSINGYKDFAGSGVVHLCGGTCSFVGAYLLGPRIGRFSGGGDNQIRGHSLPFCILGGFILCFGFLGFNGGTRASVSAPGDRVAIVRAVMNTVISGSSGAISTLIVQKIGLGGLPKSWGVLLPLNGALCGMVSICASCDDMRPWAAFVTGTTAAFMYLLLHFVVLKLEVDDPVDAVAVHAGGGFWGLMCAAFLSQKEGILTSGTTQSWKLLLSNVIGAVAIIVWSGAGSFILFYGLKLVGLLRYDEDTEVKGIDNIVHGEICYPFEAYQDDQSFAFTYPYYSKQTTPILMPTTITTANAGGGRRPGEVAVPPQFFKPMPTRTMMTAAAFENAAFANDAENVRNGNTEHRDAANHHNSTATAVSKL